MQRNAIDRNNMKLPNSFWFFYENKGRKKDVRKAKLKDWNMMIYPNIRRIEIMRLRRSKIDTSFYSIIGSWFTRSTSLGFASTTQVPSCPRRFFVRRVSRDASTFSVRRDANWKSARSTISQPSRPILATILNRCLRCPLVRSKALLLHL